MQNSLELHQPNMHIGYRVIPLSVHIVSLARFIFKWYLTHSVANFYLLQNALTTSEIFVKGFESATNMFSPVAHAKDEDSMKIIISAALLFQS